MTEIIIHERDDKNILIEVNTSEYPQDIIIPKNDMVEFISTIMNEPAALGLSELHEIRESIEMMIKIEEDYKRDETK